MSLLSPSPRLIGFLEKLKKLILVGVIILIGSVLFAACYSSWQADPVRHYLRVDATVLGHEVHLDQQRWQGRQSKALVLESRLLIPPLASSNLSSTSPKPRELVIRGFFKDAESAGDFAAARPVGRPQPCLVAPREDTAQWPHWWPSQQGAGMIFGSLLVLAGLWILCAPPVKFSAPRLPVAAACLVFAVVGVALAGGFWAGACEEIRAQDWPAVPFQKLDERTIRSGKSNSRELALRYVYQGQSHDTVVATGDLATPGETSAICRVNPANALQVRLDWGWRPALAVPLLFPIPFLTIGFGGLLALSIPASRRFFTEGGGEPDHPWGKVLMRGAALLFVGSIVGTFVAVCIEMWLTGHPFKWFLTIFLAPFVFLALRLALDFLRALQAARSGFPLPVRSRSNRRR